MYEKQQRIWIDTQIKCLVVIFTLGCRNYAAFIGLDSRPWSNHDGANNPGAVKKGNKNLLICSVKFSAQKKITKPKLICISE